MLADAWALAAKDLRMYMRDRVGLMTSLLVPIALVTVFGWIMAYAFGGGSGMPKVKLWVVDEDQTEQSQKFIEGLRASNMLDVVPRVNDKPISVAQLEERIADGDAHHGLVIPKGFAAAESQENLPDLKMIRDPGRQMEDRMIQIALLQSLFTNANVNTWRRTVSNLLEKQGLAPTYLSTFERLFNETNQVVRDGFDEAKETNVAADPKPNAVQKPVDESNTQPPDTFEFLTQVIPITNVDREPPARPKRVTFQQAQSVSGVSVMMLMFSLTGAGALLLAERERGTLRRLLSLPIRRESVLLGKFFYVAVVGLLQMAVLMAYGEAMFKVGLFRDPVTLAILVVTWVATAGSFGMVIAAFATSTKQGDGLATIVILVMAALGGCWFPVQMMNLPLPLEIASKSTLTYWAMEGFQGMLWNGLNWLDPKMLKAIGIQWLWTFGLSFASVVGFRRNYLR